MREVPEAAVAEVRDAGEARPPRTDAAARLARERIRSRLFGRTTGPVRVGRYVVLERLGVGGFGEVYAALDERLRRRVALKVVRSDRRSAPRTETLLAEARALARLAHPNVVEIFDVLVVERDDDLLEIVIAMALIEGESAHAWIARARPSPVELLRVFVEAGRGLAAAHRAGIIHRDFKPANVMIGRDARVRVVDFGIARVNEDDPSTTAATARPHETRRGFGTPAYMSPEQHAGAQLDARTDQFSFCVALWEALFGSLPYRATAAELGRSPGRSWPPSVPDVPAIPGRVRRALQRGLAINPHARFPDMDALLDVLVPRTGGRWWGLALGGLALATIASSLVRPDAHETCDGGALLLAERWDDGRREAVEQAFAATGLGYASVVAGSVVLGLDTWGDTWVAGHRSACEAHARGDDTAERLDARMTCLQRQLRSFDTLIELLVRIERESLGGAQRAVDGLPNVRACEDPAAEATAALDPAVRGAGERARSELARALVLVDAGRVEPGLEAASMVYDVVASLPDRGLIAEAAYARGYALGAVGRPAEAIPLYETSAAIARELGDDRLLVRCALGMVWQQIALGRFDTAEHWIRAARASLQRVGGDPDSEARLHNAVAALLLDRGRLDEAVAEQEAGLSLVRRVFGDADHRVPMHLGNLANILHTRGSYEAALAKYEEALAVARPSLGDDHPTTSTLRSNAVGVLVFLGRNAEAEVQARMVVEAQERTLGPDSVDVGFSLVGLGSAIEPRDPSAAIDHYTRGLAILEETLGDRSIDLVPPLTSLAQAQLRLGRLAEARVHLERARHIQEQALPGPHVGRAFVLASLARVARYEGRTADAVALAELCLEQAREAGVPEHHVAGVVRSEAGAALLAAGRADEAIAWLEAAAPIVEAALGSGEALALVRVRLAEAHATVGDRERARALLVQVRSVIASDADSHSAVLAHAALVEVIAAGPSERREAEARLRERIAAIDPPDRTRAEATLRHAPKGRPPSSASAPRRGR